MWSLAIALIASLLAASILGAPAPVYFDVVPGSGPHDVAAAPAPARPCTTPRNAPASSASSIPHSGKVEEVDARTRAPRRTA